MNLTLSSLLLMTVMGLAVGQVLFKRAAQRMLSPLDITSHVIMNADLWWALMVYAVSTVLWIALLRKVPLTVAFPFVALVYFVVPALAWWWLDEPLHWQTLAGAVLIGAGICLSAYGH